MDDDRIQIKRSQIPGLVPAAGELLDGELSVNTFDGLLFAKNSDGQVVELNPRAPIQSVASSSQSLTVTNVDGVITLGLSIEPSVQEQADWGEQDSGAPSFIKSKPTSLSAFTNDNGFVNANEAKAAAPVQQIVAGDHVVVTDSAGVVTISALQNPGTVTEIKGESPITVSGAASAPTVSVLVASSSSVGVVRLASQQDIASSTAGAVVDAAQLSSSILAAVPTKLSQLTNDTAYATTAQLSSYLPLSGGELSGPLRILTPGQTDRSNLVATTEWVRRELEAADQSFAVWSYGGSNTSSNPGSGLLRVSADGLYLAISKYASNGSLPIPVGLAQGDFIEIRSAPARVAPAVMSEAGEVITAEDGNILLLEG